MASRLQSIAGQLGATKATLYTCPSNVLASAILKVSAVNTDTVACSVNFYVKKSGSSSRRVCPEDASVEAGYQMTVEVPHVLTPGDVLEGDAGTASKVDYVISYAEFY